ncbi:MAG: hypothetical protein ABWY27_10690, partial [Telluria sp.]
LRHALYVHGCQRGGSGQAGERQQLDQRTIHAPPSVAPAKHPTFPVRRNSARRLPLTLRMVGRSTFDAAELHS